MADNLSIRMSVDFESVGAVNTKHQNLIKQLQEKNQLTISTNIDTSKIQAIEKELDKLKSKLAINNQTKINVDTSELTGGGKTFLFTLTDTFGNKATLEINRVKAAPLSLWISITGLLALSSIIYIRKRKV